MWSFNKSDDFLPYSVAISSIICMIAVWYHPLHYFAKCRRLFFFFFAPVSSCLLFYWRWRTVVYFITPPPILHDKFLGSGKIKIHHDITGCHKAHGRILKVSEFSCSVCTVVGTDLSLGLMICKNFFLEPNGFYISSFSYGQMGEKVWSITLVL